MQVDCRDQLLAEALRYLIAIAMKYKVEYIEGVGKDRILSHYKLTVYKKFLFFKYCNVIIFFDGKEMNNYIENNLV
ncbi:MAG: hypothetical protein ACK5HU_02545 [Flavobacteriales bacterium]